MIDRRRVLLSGAAVSVVAMGAPLARAADAMATGSGGAALNALFDKFVDEQIDLSPIGATALGIDTGPRAHQRSEVDDNSLAGIAKGKALIADQLARLKAFDRNSLGGMDQINYDVEMFTLSTNDEANRRYDYGTGGAGTPYVICQLNGFYSQFSDFLGQPAAAGNQGRRGCLHGSPLQGGAGAGPRRRSGAA